MPDSIDFDFRAAIEQKNRWPRPSNQPHQERAIDLATAEMLSSKKSLKAVRLLIIVEETDYRAYLSSLIVEMMPSCRAQPISRADAHILNAASAWKQQVQAVAIFSSYSQTAYSEVCSLGIRLIGSGIASKEAFVGLSTRSARQRKKKMQRLIADFCPTHIVMTTPNDDLLGWANRNRISSVVLLREWPIPLNSQEEQQHNSLLKQISRPQVKWVGAQGVLACKMMADRVATNKLIPWAWPQSHALTQCSPKQLSLERDRIHLLYAGTLNHSSNVSDLLAAASDLQQKGHQVMLQIVVEEATPPAELEALFEQSQQLGITEAVTISLAESIGQLLTQIRAADALIIPGDLPGPESKTEMPMPMQVAMAACTPIVACDRAFFSSHLIHGVNALIFPEGNQKAIVRCLERLMDQPQLYAQLSEASVAQQPANRPAIWKDLIERWMMANPADKQWLKNYAFSSGRFSQLEAYSA